MITASTHPHDVSIEQGKMNMSEICKRFSANKAGRDFFVGDIHGCFGLLEKTMEEHGFDETRDRIFSVGDLVDRGDRSEDAIDCF